MTDKRLLYTKNFWKIDKKRTSQKNNRQKNIFWQFIEEYIEMVSTNEQISKLNILEGI